MSKIDEETGTIFIMIVIAILAVASTLYFLVNY